MSDSARQLFVNVDRKALQYSDLNGSPFVIAPLNKYETTPFEIVLVRLNPQNSQGFQRVDIDNVGLKVSVNDTVDDASPLAEQATWSKDLINNVFSANLELNTAALNAYIGSATEKNIYFEIEATEGSARQKIYFAQIILKNSVAQPTTTAPAPITEYLTKAETLNKFTKFKGDAGETITFMSPNGLYQRILGISDNREPIDQIIDV